MKPARIDQDNLITAFLPKDEDKTVETLKQLINTPLSYEERMLVSSMLNGTISYDDFLKDWSAL